MRKMFRIVAHLFVALAGVALCSCALEELVDGGVQQLEPNQSEHALIMYMFADNNLAGDMLSNIYNAERGLTKSMPSARIVVYLDKADTTMLYELKYLPYGEEQHIRHCKVLKSYEKQDSSNPNIMCAVLGDVRELAPSKSYGLVVSGHGTGWFPKPSSGISYNDQRVAEKGSVAQEYQFGHLGEESMTRFVGYDNATPESSFSSADLVEGLRDMHFDYIMFDACFMGSVEFLYDLRSVADYIISSPVEVMNAGMPYEDIVPLFFAPGRDICKVAETIVDVYKNTGFSTKKSVAVSVVDCSKLENLANELAYIYRCASEGESGEPAEVVSRLVETSRLQPLDRVEPTAFYDLDDFGVELCGDDEHLLYRWQSALDEAVVYSGHTEDIWSARSAYDYWWIEDKVDGVLDLCGVSVYLPLKSAPVTSSYYFKTDWARKVYGLE